MAGRILGAFALSTFVCLGLSGAAEAQGLSGQRYELARRLSHFERAWDKEPSEAKRLAALPYLKGAVRSFFSFRLGSAMEKLDEARLALKSDPKGWSKSLRAAQSAKFPLNRRVLDASKCEISFQVGRSYGGRSDFPKGLSFRCELWAGQGGKKAWSQESAKPLSLGAKHRLNLGAIPEGDHILKISIYKGDRVLSRHCQMLSVVKSLAARIKAIEAAKDGLGKGSARSTLELQLDLIQSLRKGKTLETNIPVSLLTKRMEAMIVPGDRALAAGQHWLSFVKRGQSALVSRVQIPTDHKQAAPLVIALHGMGGSENMFFDTYGAGAIAKLCEERSWVLVAPRLGFGRRIDLDQILSGLKGKAKIDTSRIFVVGHSMGAGVASQLLSQSPKAIKGAALISGGRGFRPSADLLNVALYFAAGSEDFGRAPTKNAYKSVKDAKARRCLYEEFKNIEHLVIVQEALPNAFKFFDKEAGRKTLPSSSVKKKPGKARLY